MIWRYEIDVVDVAILHQAFDLRHHLGNSSILTQVVMGDLIVLAINALQAAATEKDRARAAGPRDRWFLAKMSFDGGNTELCAFTTIAWPW